MKAPSKYYPWLAIIPMVSILLFGIAYLVAASKYPGGSNFDSHSTGYSFKLNYWCELLAETGKNGLPNPSRIIALGGMLMLSCGLAVFWWLAPAMLNLAPAYRKTVQLFGMASMLLAIFIFTKWHDHIINIAGGLGLVALTGLLVSLFRDKHYGLLLGGAVCAAIILTNSYIYYSGHFIRYLPIVQKLGFMLVLAWVFVINMMLYQTLRNRSASR